MKLSLFPTTGPGREAVLVGAGLVLAYFFVRMSPLVAIGAFGDDGVYVALGQALASGEGYRSIYAVGQPVHIKYPPGVPMIFAVIWRLAGDLRGVETLISVLNLLVCGISAALIWRLGREQLQLSARLLFFFALAPFFLEASIQYFNLAISEPYYVLSWLAALAVYYRLKDSQVAGERLLLGAVLGLVVSASTLIRSQGIVLLPAFLLALIVDRVNWRAVATYTAAALSPIVAWLWVRGAMISQGPISSQPDEGSYGGWIPGNLIEFPGFIAKALASNWQAYWRIFPAQLSDIQALGVVLCALFLLLATVGSARLARDHPALVLTTIGNVGLIVLWPYAQERFVLTVLPLAGLLIAAALSDLGRRYPVDKRLAFALLIVIAIPIIFRQINMRGEVFNDDSIATQDELTYPSRFLIANTRYLLAASAWVMANTELADRLLIENPAGLYLHTGRRGVSSAPAESQLGPSIFQQRGRFLAERIREDSITVVALGGLRSPLASEVATFQQRCPSILEFSGVPRREAWPRFYRVVRDDACMGTLLPDGIRAPGDQRRYRAR